MPNFSSALAHLLMGAALAASATATMAADFRFTGNLHNNTDRVHVSFALASDGEVRLWTDSWNSGQNFDPIAALWRQVGNDYELVLEIDDDDTVGAGQGYYDTGMSFAGLAAGNYLFTVGASFLEPFAAGTVLSQGFTQDGTTPTPIAQWNQPSYDPNMNDQKGSFYSIRLAGVDSASISPVPEPQTYAMLLAGIGLLGGIARRRLRGGSRD